MVLFTTTKQVHIVDPADKYNLVKGVFTEMLGRLSAGSITSASAALTSTAGDKYLPILSSLGSNLVTAVAQLGAIESATFAKGVAQIMLVRTDAGGQKTGFFIYLMKGGDGIWRIDAM